jgi:uncharacterized membrane protein
MMNLFEHLAHLSQNLINGALGGSLGQWQALVLVLVLLNLVLWLPVGLFRWLERWAWDEETKRIERENQLEIARAVAIEEEEYDIKIEEEKAERLEEAARVGAYEGAHAAVLNALAKEEK